VSLRADAVFVAAAGLDSRVVVVVGEFWWGTACVVLGRYIYIFDLFAHSILFFERTGIGGSVTGSRENSCDGLFFLELAGLFWLLLLGGELLLLLLLFCAAAAFAPPLR
jgi:hypothetical protein